MRVQDEIRDFSAQDCAPCLFCVFRNKDNHKVWRQIVVLDTSKPFSKKGMSKIRKMSREKKHKWYVGLPIHIKLLFVIFNILFIGIIINEYILLILNKPYRCNFIACLFPCGAPSWGERRLIPSAAAVGPGGGGEGECPPLPQNISSINNWDKQINRESKKKQQKTRFGKCFTMNLFYCEENGNDSMVNTHILVEGFGEKKEMTSSTKTPSRKWLPKFKDWFPQRVNIY